MDSDKNLHDWLSELEADIEFMYYNFGSRNPEEPVIFEEHIEKKDGIGGKETIEAKETNAILKIIKLKELTLLIMMHDAFSFNANDLRKNGKKVKYFLKVRNNIYRSWNEIEENLKLLKEIGWLRDNQISELSNNVKPQLKELIDIARTEDEREFMIATGNNEYPTNNVAFNLMVVLLVDEILSKADMHQYKLVADFLEEQNIYHISADGISKCYQRHIYNKLELVKALKQQANDFKILLGVTPVENH